MTPVSLNVFVGSVWSPEQSGNFSVMQPGTVMEVLGFSSSFLK